jgi:hypothetical protein
MTCTVEDCGRRARARGWCHKHYMRWYVHGDPLTVLPKPGNRNRGPAANGWKGDDAGYRAAHERVRRAFGAAEEHTCLCGKQAQDWSYDGLTGYSLDINEYTALCTSCHCKRDRTHRNFGRV